MRRLFRAVCKAQVTVLKGRLRTNRSEISFERESNGWAKGADGADGANGAKGAKAERGAAWRRVGAEKGRRGEGAARRRVGAEKGRRGEGAENERRAKLTKWGG